VVDFHTLDRARAFNGLDEISCLNGVNPSQSFRGGHQGVACYARIRRFDLPQLRRWVGRAAVDAINEHQAGVAAAPGSLHYAVEDFTRPTPANRLTSAV